MAIVKAHKIVSSDIVHTDSGLLGGKPPAYYAASGVNLLHNWDFRNPVNQRGQTSYTGNVYTIDRWRMIGSTSVLKLVEGGVRLATQNARFAQLIEGFDRIQGEQVTISVEIVSNTCNGFGVMLLNKQFAAEMEYYIPFATTGIWSVTLTLPRQMENIDGICLFINSKATGEVIVSRMKLEKGTQSTLIDDPPPDYGVELVKCQRYSIMLDAATVVRASWCQPDRVAFFIPLPAPLRIAPKLERGKLTVVHPTGNPDQTGFMLYAIHQAKNGIYVYMDKTAHGLTDACVRCDDVILSAEL